MEAQVGNYQVTSCSSDGDYHVSSMGGAVSRQQEQRAFVGIPPARARAGRVTLTTAKRDRAIAAMGDHQTQCFGFQFLCSPLDLDEQLDGLCFGR